MVLDKPGVAGEKLTGPVGARDRVRLLDVDPDLAADLSPEDAAEAQRRVVIPAIDLAPGPWSVDQLAQVQGVLGRVSGFLILCGAVTTDLGIAGMVCTRLLTPGEVVLLDGWESDSIPVRYGWTTLAPATLAIFDDRLVAIGRRYPGLLGAILHRAADQIRHALMQQAICQLPRVQDRLLALMWSIADRSGVMRADGVWLELPVTHAVLAQMIGARRPTVSLGLTALAEAGTLTRHGSQWRLAPNSHEIFSPPEPAPAPVEATSPPSRI